LNIQFRFSHKMALTVRPTAHPAIHLQLDISAKALKIRVVQNPKCIV
jgi:hypothetical protein